jgi:ribosomal protein S27E
MQKEFDLVYCPKCLATTCHRLEHDHGGVKMTCTVCGKKRSGWDIKTKEKKDE